MKLASVSAFLNVVLVAASSDGVMAIDGGKKGSSSSTNGGKKGGKTSAYEVWASDQSNSVADAGALGIKGSFLWIWDSEDIEEQLDGGYDAEPIGCKPGTKGPCDLLDLFPQDLEESTSGMQLKDLTGFGRLHGVIADPQQRYVAANIFAPNGGYLGVIDTHTKEAVALFRVTELSGSRSVHMSLWNFDGSAILVANLNGRAIERINVFRDKHGTIKQVVFDKSATLGLGQGQAVTAEAAYFSMLMVIHCLAKWLVAMIMLIFPT